MHETMIGGSVLNNWLAIIGVISLMYWVWRLIAAYQHHHRARALAAALSRDAAAPARDAAAAGETTYTGAPPEHVVAITAAITAMLGSHHIIHLEAVRGGQHWAAEGRWLQQTSHNPS
jgi:hypothetical protein